MQTDVASSPLSRAEWLAARAALASRRIGRFALGAVVTFGAVLLLLQVIPNRGVPVQEEVPGAKEASEDTVRLQRAAREATSAAAGADSVYDYVLLAEGGALSTRMPIDTLRARVTRDSMRAIALATSAALDTARLRAANRDRQGGGANDRPKRIVPPVAMLIASTVLAIILGFSATLLVEILRPTIASTHEAEATARCPSFLVDSDEIYGTQAGMDSFRMLYLGITADTPPAGTVEVRGDERSVTAIVAARLALAAARDERATAVVDADAEGSAIAGYYRQRPDPGFTDAVAGVRLWREVTRTVATSDGHPIDVVPGGSVRREPLDADARLVARAEFARFRAEYDFLVAVAPSELAVARLRCLFERPTVLLCATVGVTTVAALRSNASQIRSTGANVHGVVLWNADLPRVPSRKTLMNNALANESRAHRRATEITPL
jgi:hypothetical protein